MSGTTPTICCGSPSSPAEGIDPRRQDDFREKLRSPVIRNIAIHGPSHYQWVGPETGTQTFVKIC
jgi:hypothetical protein